jgi:hypothetical protein
MHVRGLVQNFQRNKNLSQHVERKTRFFIRREIFKVVTTDEGFKGLATVSHLQLRYCVCVLEA